MTYMQIDTPEFYSRERSAAAADASDLVGIGVCVTNASVTRSGRLQAVSKSDRFYNFYSLYNTVEIPL